MKKVIVITGGNSGLGKETARLLSKKNTVVILGKNESTVNAAAKKFNGYGVICDVTDATSIRNAVSKILKKFKKIDCLVNCAGVYIRGPIEENDPAKIKENILVNTLGPTLMVNAVVPRMKKQKYGRIVNVISTAGKIPKPDRSVYHASKWGLTGFTKSIRLELARFNIGVMGFYPGFIHTDIAQHAGYQKPNFSDAMPVTKCAKVLVSMIEVDPELVINDLEVQSIKYVEYNPKSKK